MTKLFIHPGLLIHLFVCLLHINQVSDIENKIAALSAKGQSIDKAKRKVNNWILTKIPLLTWQNNSYLELFLSFRHWVNNIKGSFPKTFLQTECIFNPKQDIIFFNYMLICINRFLSIFIHLLNIHPCTQFLIYTLWSISKSC